jgi:transposase-like protein
VVSRPVFVTVGVDTDGRRKILAIDIALEESYLSYRDHFNTLKERGLKQVNLTGVNPSG